MNEPKVYRPQAHAVWEKEHRWGKEFGDVRRYVVMAAASGQLTIMVGKTGVDIPAELSDWFADSVKQATEWEA